jgi:hypothetical protein
MKARRLLRTEAIQICEERFVSDADSLAKRYGINVDTVYAIWNGVEPQKSGQDWQAATHG